LNGEESFPYTSAGRVIFGILKKVGNRRLRKGEQLPKRAHKGGGEEVPLGELRSGGGALGEN